MSSEQPLEGIAIVGIAGRFPGANNVAEFWRNLLAAEETISTLSDEQLRANGLDPETLRSSGSYVPRRGLLDKPAHFDAPFFGISPREAEVMDPQQRVFLEECWAALEDAACDPARYSGAIGVFAGMSNNTYWANNVVHHPELIDSVGALTAMMANEKDYLATRVAYKLNLHGPALNIYTACSTSLVAVCQAVQSLLNFACDTALAGGISITFPQERGYEFTEGGITSPDGHCRAFDECAAGTVFSSGVGVVVLKRLTDAVNDGDQIYAVIKSAALNNDGSGKVSFTAPSVDGHAEVIALAHALAGIEPRTIGYIEAHGTGTSLGDPIEIAGLTQAFRASTDDKNFCAIGSVKTNIGHLDAAAGIAGLIKTALILRHGKIPPSLHFTKPNPQLSLDESPFYVNTALTDWPADEHPRRAAVSSFGVGGTNAHCILEEPPQNGTGVTPAEPHSGRDACESGFSTILPLSAKTGTALAQFGENLAAHIESNPDLPFTAIAHTLQTGRAQFAHRIAITAATREIAISALRGFEPKRTLAGVASTPRIVLMFPGQGAQFPGMGAQLYADEPVFRAALDRCHDALAPTLDLRAIIFASGENAHEQLRETRITQPAIFAVSYALAQLWISWGVQPAALVGHSVGEYVAATLAGVFTLEDAIRLVAQRAALVQAQPRGAMLAVRLSESEAANLADDQISIAAINSPKLCVLAGPDAAIAAVEADLGAQGVAAKRLETSHAFHSAMIDAVIAPLETAIAKVARHAPAIPIFSTVTADWLGDADATDPRYWARHARDAVRFSPAIARLLAEPNHIFIECGPGQTLTQLVRQHGCANRVVLTSMREGAAEIETLHAALAQLWTHGVHVKWDAVRHGARPAHVSLPAYPFERHRYFAEPPAGTNTARVCGTAATSSIAPSLDESPTVEATQSSIAPLTLPSRILAILSELSGNDLTGADPNLSFVELGFDSLSLTQAAIALHKNFRVKVTFRQLLQDVSSPATLAEYLEKQIATRPDEILKSAAKVGATTSSVPQAHKAHGPFRAIDRNATTLTTAQQAHLDDLIARYTARTGKSKSAIAAHRAHLADPRAVAGFRREWKEMIYPLICERSEGSRLWDADGNEYTDITLGFGQILFGHRPQWLIAAIEHQLHSGIEIGPTSPLAGQLAERLSRYLSLDRVAFCNTGSEAVAAALRLARTVTGRDKVAVFSGAYHGIFDEVLFRPGPLPIAPGIPASAVQNLVVLDYGTDESLEWLRAHADELAAIMVEPVQSRRPSLAPREFLRELRRITNDAGAALIFDEIVTGFRTAPGGAQEFFGVNADIATYGKVIGGGMPIGIIAGARNFMDALDGGAWNYGDDSFPEVGVTFFAGTFVRHPLALAAASAVLDALERHGPVLQQTLAEKARSLAARMNSCLDAHGVPLRWEQFSSMYHLPLPAEHRYAALIFYHLRLRGIHAWENRPCFLSAAHTDADIEKIANAFEQSVAALVGANLLPAGKQPPAAAAASAANGNSADFPLTHAQSEIFLATHLGDEASTAFNDTVVLRIHGDIHHDTLRAALAGTVKRHDSLRTTISADGSAQTVHDNVSTDFTYDDLSDLAAPMQSEAITGCIARDTETPFVLADAPLFRARLLKIAEGEHLFAFTAHHIVCDGWSFAIVATEIAGNYSATAQGCPAHIETALSFREYAARQRGKMGGEEDRATEAWWLAQFTTIPAPLDLPADKPRSRQRTFNAATRSALLPAEICESLRKLSAARQATIFSTMLAAFYTLLHRLSGQADIVVGIASAGQTTAGDGALVGHCVNFLPLRLALDGAQPFDALLPRVNNLVLDAREHQDFTFGRLLTHLALPRDPSRIPLVSVSFNVDRAPSTLRFDTASADFAPLEKTRYGLELSFNLIESDGGYRLFCHFNRDLFAAETIERWLGHYGTLLAAIANSPATPIDELALLTSEESSHILNDWNTTARPYPRDTGLDTLFEQNAARTPNAVAIVHGVLSLTYAELNVRANRIAHRLLASGMQPGALVGLCSGRSAEMVAAMLAVVKAGGAYVPLDPAWPTERVQFMAKDGGLFCVITYSSHAAMFERFDGPLVLLDEQTPPPHVCDDNPDVPTDGGSPAHVIYTSGSTGKPKGVVIPHRGVAHLVLGTDYAQLTSSDVVAHVSNPAFDATTWEVWGALLNGARCVILEKDVMLSPAQLGAAIRDLGISAMLVTTALFNQIAIQLPETFAPLRFLLFGGEASNPHCVSRVFDSQPPTHILNAYGPTETSVIATCHEITCVGRNDATVPIGKPIANTTVYILDSKFKTVPIGVAGELHVGGDGLALHYHNRPELTAERFITWNGIRLYRTGDSARWRADGTIEFLTRLDEQVKLRGFRVELGEIENALLQHPDVRGAVVRLQGSSLVAYIVAHDPMPDDGRLRTFLLRTLPDYMVPSTFIALDQIPLTANGKVDHRALPTPTKSEVSVAIAPRNDTETRIAALMAAVLGRESVDVTDDFFLLGGHSLLAMDLLARIKREFSIELPASRLFETPSVDGLAAACISKINTTATQPGSELDSPRYLMNIQRGDSKRAPLFLVAGGWGGEIEFLVYAQIARHLGSEQPIHGLKARGAGTADPPHETVTEMAADYLREIRAVQPHGPYFLAGECVGGICAHEIACQFREAGEKVALLMLFDTSVPNPDELADYLRAEEIKRAAENAPPGFFVRIRRMLGKVVRAFLGKRHKQPRPADAGNQHPRGQERYPVTLMQHRPRPYDGAVQLVVDAESRRLYGSLGWENAQVGALHIHELPGDHITYIREFGESAAAKVRELLKQADSL